MIKHFCDVCGKETELSAIRAKIKNASLNLRQMFDTQGHFCKYCIIDAVKSLDDRVEVKKWDHVLSGNPATVSEPSLDDVQIKHMAQRFLHWKLPKKFHPDCGISFKAEYNQNTAYPSRHEPSGTNLLDADQAEEMVRYLTEQKPKGAA